MNTHTNIYNTDGMIIFGGTFDPIHSAHLLLAEYVHKKFQLPIAFMPVHIPLHKHMPKALPQQRLDMLKLAINHRPYFSVNTVQLRHNGPSYIYEAISQIRSNVTTSTPLFFIIGTDAFLHFDSWDNSKNRWRQILELTNFIIAPRPGYSLNALNKQLHIEFKNRYVKTFDRLTCKPAGNFYIVDFHHINISSTQVRHLARQSLPLQNIVPQGIKDYIKRHSLYL